MLQKLFIQNYLLIDSLELDMNPGFSIITGETGAGKSILMGALSMLLGERADKNVLLDKQSKCIVEGSFLTGHREIKKFLAREGLDSGEQLILRREINSEGRSRSFINDTPVTLSQLKELGEQLVDIHSQHETLFLRRHKFQLSVVDAFAGTSGMLEEYGNVFSDYGQALKQLAALEEEEKKSKADQDYYQFLYDELATVALKEGEQEKAEQELKAMTHAEEIKSNLEEAQNVLSGGEDNLLSNLNRIQSLMQSSAKHLSSLDELSQRLKSVVIELKDVTAEIESAGDRVSSDPGHIERLQERLNEIYRLEQKHRVSTVDELNRLMQDFESRLQGIATLSGEIDKCRESVREKKEWLMVEAKKISQKRNKAIPLAEKEIAQLLVSVNLPDAILKIENQVNDAANFTADGIDSVSFLFSANKGLPLREIEKSASGGELSRLMLCIKAAVARLVALPTMIFDEIDTGISGKTAMNVASVLKELSRNHQLIAITHLPQIAGQGDQHYYVFKEFEKKRTVARVKLLTRDERIVEIAKMLSGDKPSAVAVENARELMKN